MSDIKRIVFDRPNSVSLEKAGGLSDTSALVQNDYSIVSAGTELAILSGKESWAKLPFVPGYGSVGTVVRQGEGCELAEGTRVFTYGKHASVTETNTLTVAVPDSVPGAHAVFARMALVSITAIRVSHVELGDWVAVFGAGVVGNLAAQLAGLSGARTIIVDQSANRLAIARECGIDHCINADGQEIQTITDITGGDRCSTVIEATGVTAVAEHAMDAAATNGELVLLGTPRNEHSPRFVDFLRKIHLANSFVTVTGAHEWCYPLAPGKGRDSKHSITRNAHIVLDLIRTKRLRIEELITDVVTPEEAPEIYSALVLDPDRHLGVVVDWSQDRPVSKDRLQ